MRAQPFVLMLPWGSAISPVHRDNWTSGWSKPYLLRELRENDTYRWRIIDAIKDINLFLDWHLAEKALSKYEEP